MQQFQEVFEYLIKNKYILASQGKYTLSKAFQDMTIKMKREKENGVVRTMVPSQERHRPTTLPSMMEGNLHQLPEVVLKYGVNLTGKNVSWVDAFIQFITEAKVPARLEGSRGDVYAANKYSEDGMKAFRKTIESGVDYGVLVRSTMLYYKSSTRFKKTIGNYMAHGDWRTDYEALRSAAIDGTTAIEQHIKQETKDNGHNPYRLG